MQMMKHKVFTLLLALSFTACALTGCGKGWPEEAAAEVSEVSEGGAPAEEIVSHIQEAINEYAGAGKSGPEGAAASELVEGGEAALEIASHMQEAIDEYAGAGNVEFPPEIAEDYTLEMLSWNLDNYREKGWDGFLDECRDVLGMPDDATREEVLYSLAVAYCGDCNRGTFCTREEYPPKGE